MIEHQTYYEPYQLEAIHNLDRLACQDLPVDHELSRFCHEPVLPKRRSLASSKRQKNLPLPRESSNQLQRQLQTIKKRFSFLQGKINTFLNEERHHLSVNSSMNERYINNASRINVPVQSGKQAINLLYEKLKNSYISDSVPRHSLKKRNLYDRNMQMIITRLKPLTQRRAALKKQAQLRRENNRVLNLLVSSRPFNMRQ